MKIGFSSTCIWRLSPVNCIYFAKRIRVHSFELWADHYFINADRPMEIRNAISETGIIPTVHASSWDLNITSTSKDVRDFSIEQIRKSIDLAYEIGAKIITVHPGRKSFFRAEETEISKTQREIFHDFYRYSDGKDVKICIENIEDTGKEVMVTETDFFNFFAGISDALYVTMDITHLGDFEKIKNFYSTLKEKILHIHISDFNSSEMHIPMGKGALQTEQVLSYLNGSYDGIFDLEFYRNDPAGRDVRSSVSYLKKIGKKVGYK